jgi:hypothetical protein
MIKHIYPNSHTNTHKLRECIHSLPVRVKAQHTHACTAFGVCVDVPHSLTTTHPRSSSHPQSFVFSITCAHHCESGHQLLLFGCLSVCPPAFSYVVFVLCKHLNIRARARTNVERTYAITCFHSMYSTRVAWYTKMGVRNCLVVEVSQQYF